MEEKETKDKPTTQPPPTPTQQASTQPQATPPVNNPPQTAQKPKKSKKKSKTRGRLIFRSGKYAAYADRDSELAIKICLLQEDIRTSHSGNDEIEAVLYKRDPKKPLEFVSGAEGLVQVDLVLNTVKAGKQEDFLDDSGEDRVRVAFSKRTLSTLRDLSYEYYNMDLEDEKEDAGGGDGALLGKRGAKNKAAAGKKKKKVDPLYKKGKFNKNVSALDIDENLESDFDGLRPDLSDHCANNELIRAVATKNENLLKKLLEIENRFIGRATWWGPECQRTALTELFRIGDFNLIKVFNQANQTDPLKSFKKKQRAEEFGIKHIDTGHNNKYAYGVATRKVALGRGNREGNMAFIGDPTPQEPIGYFYASNFQNTWTEHVIMGHLTKELYQKVKMETNFGFLEDFRSFALFVRNGKNELAHYLGESLLKRDGFGLNQLHVKALTATTVEELGAKVKAVSVKKKTYGSNLIYPIHCAAVNPAVEVFKHLFELLDNKLIQDENFSAVIHYAAASSTPGNLAHLIEQNQPIDMVNNEKATPLIIAAQHGRHQNVDLLLKKGAEWKKLKTKEGYGAIHYAAIFGNWKVIEVMHKFGCDINQNGKGSASPLHLASEQGHLSTVRYLLSIGAKTFKRDKFKRTPLLVALRNNHVQIASLLLTHGCPWDTPDSSDNYPLHYACAYGGIQMIDRILKTGADLNQFNSWKLTPIAVAMLKNHKNIIKKMLRFPEIDVNCKDDQGRTMVSNSVRSLNRDSLELVELLVNKHHADIGIVDIRKKLPIHHLFYKFYDVAEVETLLKQGRFASSTDFERYLEESDTLYLRWVKALANNLSYFLRKEESNITPLQALTRQFKNYINYSVSRNFYREQSNHYGYGRVQNSRKDLLHDHLENDVIWLNSRIRRITMVMDYVLELFLKAKQAEADQKTEMEVENEGKGETPKTAQNQDSGGNGGLENPYNQTDAAIVLQNTTEDAERVKKQLQKPLTQKFEEANQSILSDFLKDMSDIIFSASIANANLMHNNSSTQKSKEEIEHAKTRLSRIIQFTKEMTAKLANEFCFDVEASSELQVQIDRKSRMTIFESHFESAKEQVLKCLLLRWEKLTQIPPKSNYRKKAAQNTQNGQFGQNSNFRNRGYNQYRNRGTFGYNSYNQYGGGRWGQQQPQNYTGFDLEVWNEFKDFRDFEADQRQSLVIDLLDLMNFAQKSTIKQDWKKHHLLCSETLNILELVIMKNSVTTLGLEGSTNTQLVLGAVKKYLESNISICRQFIEMARCGEAEGKAAVVGSCQTLLDKFIRLCPLVFAGLSHYGQVPEEKKPKIQNSNFGNSGSFGNNFGNNSSIWGSGQTSGGAIALGMGSGGGMTTQSGTFRKLGLFGTGRQQGRIKTFGGRGSGLFATGNNPFSAHQQLPQQIHQNDQNEGNGDQGGEKQEQTAPVDKKPGNSIKKMELESRLDFLIWFLKQLDPRPHISSATSAMSQEVSKLEKIDQKSEKIKEEISRKSYQNSLIKTFESFIQMFFTQIFCNLTSQLLQGPNGGLDLDFQSVVISKLSTFCADFLDILFTQMDGDWYPYAAQRVCEATIQRFDNLFGDQAQIHEIDDSFLTDAEKVQRRDKIELNKQLIASKRLLFTKIVDMALEILNKSSAPKPSNHPDLDSTYSISNRIAPQTTSADTIFQTFFKFQNSILRRHKELEQHSQAIQAEMVVLRDKAFLLARGMVQKGIFGFYPIGRYRYLRLFDVLDRVEFYADFSPDHKGTNLLVLENLKMLGEVVGQISGSLDLERPDPDYINLVSYDKNGHAHKEDLEAWILKNLSPLAKLVKSKNFTGFELFETIDELRHDYVDERLSAIKSYQLEDEILAQIEKIAKIKIELFEAIFEAVVKGYSHPRSYSGLGVDSIPILIKNSFVYRNCSESSFDQKDRNSGPLIDKFNSWRREALLRVVEKALNIAKSTSKFSNKNHILAICHAYRSLGKRESNAEIILEALKRFLGKIGDFHIPDSNNQVLFNLAGERNMMGAGDAKSVPRDLYKVLFDHTSVINPIAIPKDVDLNNSKIVVERKDSLFQRALLNKNLGLLAELLSRKDQFPALELGKPYNQNLLLELVTALDNEHCLDVLTQLCSRIDEKSPILNFVENGFNCLTKLIYCVFIEGSNTYLGANRLDVLADIISTLVNAGVDKNYQFHDSDQMAKLEANKDHIHPHLHLEGCNILHLIAKSLTESKISNFSDKVNKFITRLLTDLKIDPNAQNHQGRTPLHTLTTSKSTELSTTLIFLKNGADPNIKDKTDTTALFSPVRNNRLPLIKQLVEHNANLNICNKEGVSPLTLAIQSKDVVLVEEILGLRADPNFKDHFGRNSLHWAINYSDPGANASFEVESVLIEHGAELNTTDRFGRTPLHYPFIKTNDFTVSGHIDPVESVNSLLGKKDLLIDQQDVFGNTPLMYAAQRGALVSTLYLLNKGADIHKRNVEGNNSLTIAMINANFNLAVLLLNNGAEWDSAVFKYSGEVRERFYELACQRLAPGGDEGGELAGNLENGFREILAGDEDLVNIHGFRWAVRNDWQGLAYMILTRGYNIGNAVYDTILENKFRYTFNLLTKREEKEIYQFTGEEGNNLAHLIAGKSQKINKNLLSKIVWILNKKEISFTKENLKAETPLHWAARSGSDEMLRMMLEIGVDTSKKTLEGLSPLHTAFESLNLQVFRRLLENTPNALSLDRHGRNVGHYAAMCQSDGKQFLEFFEYLETKEVDFNVKDTHGKLPLHYLAKFNPNCKPVLKFLLEKTQNVDERDSKGQTALMIFAKTKKTKIKVLNKYLKVCKDLDSVDSLGRCLLSNLVQSNENRGDFLETTLEDVFGKLEIAGDVVASLRVGWEPERDPVTGKRVPVYKKISLLDWAFYKHSGYLGLSAFLIKKGARADRGNFLGQSTLKIVLLNGSNDCLKQVLETYRYPLDTEFSLEFKIFVSKNGKNRKIRNFQNSAITGLFGDRNGFAGANEGQGETEDVEIITRNPHCLNYMIYKKKKKKYIKLLLLKGFNPNKRDQDGYNAVTYACLTRQFDYIKHILDVQRSQDIQDPELRININIDVPASFENHQIASTPLNQLLLHAPGSIDLLHTVLELGVDINKEKGKKPSFYILKNAARKGQANTMTQFVNGFHKSNPNAKDHGVNQTPLWFDFNLRISTFYKVLDVERTVEADPLFYCVAHSVSQNFVERMLERVVSLNFLDDETGFSALSLALVKNRRDLVEIVILTAAGQTDFCEYNKFARKRHDWRSDAERVLPFNVSFREKTLKSLAEKDLTENGENDVSDDDDESGMVFEDPEDAPGAPNEGKMEEEAQIDPKVAENYPLIFMYENGYSEDLIVTAVELGADVNLQQPSSTQNLIMKAILKNDENLVKKAILAFTARGGTIESNTVDKHGKTPIHYVVSSHKNGSYENKSLLEFLAKYYNINQPDASNLPPIHYASLQDSGEMAKTLYSLGVAEYTIPFGVRRAPTSLIAFTTFPENPPKYEEDAEFFVSEKNAELKKQILEEKIEVPLDTHCKLTNSTVVIHADYGPYDTYMVKTDIKKGEFSGNTFYRMQLLYEYNREVFFLYTRWGRVGESGQQQMTAFSNKEGAEEEFVKLFKSKTGNDWEDKATGFIRKPKKYKIVPFEKTPENEFLVDFYAKKTDDDLPASSLSKKLMEIMKDITQLKIYNSVLRGHQISSDYLPLHKLDRTNLLQARELLLELKKLSKSWSDARYNSTEEIDYEALFQLMDQICQLTNQYYEIVPNTRERTHNIRPLQSERQINHQLVLVRELLDVEVSVKIILGAHRRMDEIHPLEYCYNCLGAKIMEVESKSLEGEAILEYVKKTDSHLGAFNTTIYAVERKGEKERFEPWLGEHCCRKLLWHGSKTENFIGILKDGLKIAPPEALSTGQRFGKGIYFSDSFAKSKMYTSDNKRIILLCEVALGRCKELDRQEDLAKVDWEKRDFDCLLALGRSRPDEEREVVIPNGMVMPIGDVLVHEVHLAQWNEFVVFDESQVKIRYIVVY